MSVGGKREGSGRKPMKPSCKRKQISLYVAPETYERMGKLRERGVNFGRHLDRLVDDLCEDLGVY